MVNLTLSIPKDLKARMDAHSHVKWSVAVREVIRSRLDQFEESEELAAKSTLKIDDVNELSSKVSRSMAKHTRKLTN